MIEYSFPITILVYYRLIMSGCFEDQENRDKKETRPQERTRDPKLCPVTKWGRAVQQVIQVVKGPNDNTHICSINVRGSKLKFITQEYTLQFMRKVYAFYGGYNRFGFHPEEIRNKLIRSSAAMALFLMDHLLDQIS